MFGSGNVEARLQILERQLAELSTRLSTVAERVERTQAAKLTAELDDLRGALEVHARGIRSELGKLWKRVPAERTNVEPLDRNALRRQYLPGNNT